MVALRCQCFLPHFRVFFDFSGFSSSFLSVSFLLFLQKVFFLFFSGFPSYYFTKGFLPICFTKSFLPIFLKKVSFLFFQCFVPCFFESFLPIPIFLQKVSFLFSYKKFPSSFFQCFLRHFPIVSFFMLMFPSKFDLEGNSI